MIFPTLNNQIIYFYFQKLLGNKKVNKIPEIQFVEIHNFLQGELFYQR